MIEKLKSVGSFLVANWKITSIAIAGIIILIVINVSVRYIYYRFKRPDATVPANQTRPVDYLGDTNYENCQFTSNIGDPDERHSFCVDISNSAE